MERFFRGIYIYLNKTNWYDLCDWIFSDHFSETYWKNYSGQFIKKVKRIEGIKKNTIIHKSSSTLKFPQNQSKAKYLILIGNGNGEGYDLLRHIRNGIAHDNVKVVIQKGNPYLDLKDYKDNSKSEQTAYIHVPLEFIMKLYDIYCICEDRAKKRK